MMRDKMFKMHSPGGAAVCFVVVGPGFSPMIGTAWQHTSQFKNSWMNGENASTYL